MENLKIQQQQSYNKEHKRKESQKKNFILVDKIKKLSG